MLNVLSERSKYEFHQYRPNCRSPYRLQGSTEVVVIRDLQGFQFSRLNSLLSCAFSRQEKKIKIIGIINGYVKIESHLNTLNTELC